jgi:hypothetical protein
MVKNIGNNYSRTWNLSSPFHGNDVPLTHNNHQLRKEEEKRESNAPLISSP